MIPSVLSTQVIQGVKDFLTTTFHSTTPAFSGAIERFVEEEGMLFKGPYFSIALPFRKGSRKKRFFPEILESSFVPYLHQELAFERLGVEKPLPTLVATGTGSGKTESFMYPILEYCRLHKSQHGVKAIIIYPMNALAADQAKRFAKAISSAQALKGVRVGLFVGGEDGDRQSQMSKDYVITDKDILRRDPPDILLTNYKMLDFLLMRPKDQTLWKYNIGTGVLKFLAVDEIHTFDGAQGTDLASLLRRLRAKLQIEKGSLGCIGTSATLGTEGSESIRDFASRVFSETFDANSVIEEHRIDADEFLRDVQNDFFNFPMPDRLEELLYTNYQNMEGYIAAQYALWFGESGNEVASTDFRIRLGKRLKELSLFKLLLRHAGGEIVEKRKLVDIFRKHILARNGGLRYYEALIDSLLALLSWAKGEPLGEYVPPFLHLRVQLWLREMTRMVGSLEAQPKIRFSHDLGGKEEQKYYPLIHCRECHAMGWGGVKKEGDDELIDDLDLFYKVFFAKDPRLRFIFPVEESFSAPHGRIYHIDTATGREAVESGRDEERVLVWESDTRVDGKAKSHNDCPFCGNKNALTILGSRAASLGSVMIGQSFASSYNDDKKLIAFSDSVQDAAHRAGFFGARSWQFTMRGVIQQALEAEGGSVRMSELSKVVANHWREKLESRERYIATLIAPDMIWLRAYEILQKSGKLPKESDIERLVNERLDWHIYSEFGYRSHIGRTLERSGASTVGFKPLEALTKALLPKLQNDFEPLRELDEVKLEKFIYGLLQHMRKQGAIFNSHLGSYIARGGHIYAFTKFQQFYMASFTFRSRSPAFLTTGPFQNFEKIHNKTKSTWCDWWVQVNFLDNILLTGSYAEALYKKVMQALIEYHFVEEREVSGAPVWGLKPENLRIESGVVQLHCNRCGDVLTVVNGEKNRAAGVYCLRKGCEGHYEISSTKADFYRDLFRYGDIERIVAVEHTGLLERSDRERVERSFIERSSKEPWKPNLLSATPTLEMGIDIGDLSSVLLCSTPPSAANYLQRIGRAGRKDGNALNATVANAQPHDLYFYSEPMEMMRGKIEAPGIFIDASAILQRQFLAFCMDRWVYEKSVDESAIPWKLSKVLSAVKEKHRERFPWTLIGFISENVDSLLEEFFSLYGEELHEKTREELRIFAKGNVEEIQETEWPDELKEAKSLSYKLLHRLELVIAERDALARQIDFLKEKIRTHKATEAKDRDWQEELQKLESELTGLRSVRRMINKKETFEFFTNEGLLPNYAFPESGVTLKSIIYRHKEKIQGDDGAGYESFSFEYERPGSSAISELAPHNRFYAGGRKVRIDQIDMKISEIETWRFCDRCSYSRREGATVESVCPRCGSPMWCDAGQKRDLIRLRQVMATTGDRQSRLMDDSDQREPLFYTKQLLIDIESDQIQEAWVTESETSPFGFEFVQKAHFKEINFGEFSLTGEEVSIAGKRTPRNGFILCRCCGKVQKKKPEDPNFKPVHAFSCECSDPNDPENFVESLYLYRDFDSEAIRMLLPMTTMANDEEKLHSLIAAFQMGLKAYFGGSVDHLRVGLHEEGVAGEEYRKQFLVLYDTIPGGTGYLRQLMRGNYPLFDVLELAYNELNTCVCNEDPQKDGCYRCIYAYRNNFDRPLVSRDRAKEVIEEILTYKERVKRVENLSAVSVDGLFDSELEARFLKKLSSYCEEGVRAKLREYVTRNGRAGYLLEIGERRYEIEQQVELGERNGVSISSRADFVIYPDEGKPIVVFTDGYAFHKDRLELDSAQRMAILESGNYEVWSITWEDVEKEGLNEESCLNFIDRDSFNPVVLARYCNDDSFMEQNSFQWLMKRLAQGDKALWSKRADSVTLSMMQGVIKKETSAWEDIMEILSTEMKEILDELKEPIVYGQKTYESMRLFVLGELKSINRNDFSKLVAAIYLNDEEQVDKALWAGMLRLWNLLQFVSYPFWTTKKGLESGMYDAIDWFKEQEKAVDKEWNGVYEEVLEEAKALVKALAGAGVPLPEVGYEITDESGKVLADTELAWPDKKIGVVLGEIPDTIGGWHLFSVEEKELLIRHLNEGEK
ncbi:helicase, C-terminal:type III restriction enzyme, res subunit:DEAD/DEAH box helicase, N-terminal [Hydrogenimonas sp.]|nr:helicase, C-terminal:type III restriction enzyme, res subunit:DEAD/DEAH box helicase, N-terminal [Hydrogenimonas sp.]